MSKPEDFMVQAWKQQLDIGLRITEAIIEGATKIREIELEAATNAHADAEATRKAIAAAGEPAQLLKLQTEWAQANAQKCAAYWRSLYEAASQTQAELLRCASGQPAAALSPDEPKKALLGAIDNAYRQWFEATQQFYKLPAMAAEPKSEQRAAA